MRFPHFPDLLDDFGQHAAPYDVSRMITVQINVHGLRFYDGSGSSQVLAQSAIVYELPVLFPSR
jgi:hypothetical protein